MAKTVDSPEDYMTTKEAAKYRHISVSTIYRLIHEGLLVPKKLPGEHARKLWLTRRQLDGLDGHR